MGKRHASFDFFPRLHGGDLEVGASPAGAALFSNVCEDKSREHGFLLLLLLEAAWFTSATCSGNSHSW